MNIKQQENIIIKALIKEKIQLIKELNNKDIIINNLLEKLKVKENCSVGK